MTGDRAASLAEAAGVHLDLVSAPFTLPRSRLLVRRGERGIDVATSEYERSLADCTVATGLTVFDEHGAELPVTRVLPARIEFGGGQVSLTFAGPHALSIGSRTDAGWSLTLNAGFGGGEGRMDGVRLEHEVAHWRPALPAATSVRVTLADGTSSISGEEVRVRLAGASASVRLSVGDEGESEPPRSHAQHRADTEAVWAAWFEKCPQVREDLQAMTAFCWWVLGANIVELPGQGHARAVVPSKIGYVGLWQWDAYFIAVGLRHGDRELALEQLDLALRFPSPNGQLPDVVHDAGVLMSSEDLPPGDLENLRRHGSSAADPAKPVPLTKPPLAAWALRKVIGPDVDEGWLRRAVETVSRSQDWWFSHADSDGDGLPEYEHPYSSGLDDSPVFDHDLPLTSPDLGAYLVVQDTELATFRRQLGDDLNATRHERRANATLQRLLSLWDAGERRFRPRGAGMPVDEETALGLLPLLTGRMPVDVVAGIRHALADPERFGTRYAVPTVAACDPSFSPERMWRGPVWININALLVDGLAASGFADEATELAERTVQLVIDGGGPHEYFNPFTGQRAGRATTSFGWSAALFIDLAVRLT